MYAVATFLVVATLSMLFTRFVTGALISTGMPPESASFQARSAFTGAGFTTTEAENVVNHPTRRRLISTSMFVGNLGVPTLVVTVLLGLLAPGPAETSTRMLTLAAGATVLVVLSFLPPVTRWLVELGRRTTQPVVRRALTGKVQNLFVLGSDWSVVALPFGSDVELRSIRGIQQALPRVKVLGIMKEGHRSDFVAGPPTDIDVESGDHLVVLARSDDLADWGFSGQSQREG